MLPVAEAVALREALGLDVLYLGQFLYGLFLTGLFEGVGLDGAFVLEIDEGDLCDISGPVLF